jgi:hypothetical protein
MAKFDRPAPAYLSSSSAHTAYVSHSTFKEFHISKSGLSNLELTSQGTAQTQYHVETSLYNPSKKHFTIHNGTDIKGAILGTVDLKDFSGHYTISLSTALASYTLVILELDRIDGVHPCHKFTYVAANGERKEYVWRHPHEKLLSSREDRELVSVDAGEDGEEEVVLAQYLKNGGGHRWKTKGGLLVREGGDRDWELVVILTAVALLITRRREQ